MTIDNFIQNSLPDSLYGKVDIYYVNKILNNKILFNHINPKGKHTVQYSVAIAYYLYVNMDKDIIFVNELLSNKSIVISWVIKILRHNNIHITQDNGKVIYLDNSNRLITCGYKNKPYGYGFDWVFMIDVDYVTKDKVIDFFNFVYPIVVSNKYCKLTINYYGLHTNTEKSMKLLERKHKISKLINSKS